MARYDRLTTLISRFRLEVTPAPSGEAVLGILGDWESGAQKVIFLPAGPGLEPEEPDVLFSAAVEWGGELNPLIAALPPKVEYDLAEHPGMANVAALMCEEMKNERCGLHSVISRLGEVLLVHMLRAQISTGSTSPGLVGGLSDPRLSRAIVAMHDEPGRAWRREDLAEIAGMSLSRFSEVFLDLVGETPSAYLRRWRLVLAQQDLRRGQRVDTIARRYGYASAEGFARAFRRQYGCNPIELRFEGAA